jgi:hypothetical protein
MKKLILYFVFILCGVTTSAQISKKENISQPAKWGIANNFSLKGDIGQIIINLPVQATLISTITRSGEVKKLHNLRNSEPKDLPPGLYDLTFLGIKIPAVVVEKGKETRILAGVLNSTVKGSWEVWTSDSIKIFSSGSPKMIALPVGNYLLKTQGAEIKTTIRDGKISLFSFTKF